MATQKTFKIPAPAYKPNYHQYAAGAPGDTRPIKYRYAERIIEQMALDKIQGLNTKDRVDIFEALTLAFTAGQAHQKDNPE